jgi:hypothetical protein
MSAHPGPTGGLTRSSPRAGAESRQDRRSTSPPSCAVPQPGGSRPTNTAETVSGWPPFFRHGEHRSIVNRDDAGSDGMTPNRWGEECPMPPAFMWRRCWAGRPDVQFRMRRMQGSRFTGARFRRIDCRRTGLSGTRVGPGCGLFGPVPAAAAMVRPTMPVIARPARIDSESVTVDGGRCGRQGPVDRDRSGIAHPRRG